jgi:DNA-binding transcriptional LysR family regulator
VVAAAVEAGLGATAISASVAAPSIEAGLLHQVAFRLPEREFHVLRRWERYRSPVGLLRPRGQWPRGRRR